MWLAHAVVVLAVLVVLYAVVRIAVAHGIRAALRDDAPTDVGLRSSDLIGAKDQAPRRRSPR